MYSNKSKYLRAVEYAKQVGKAGDEETIKARYIQLGGLLKEEVQSETPEVVAEEVTATPVRRARRVNSK